MHKILLFAFLVMTVVELGGSGVHFILARQVLQSSTVHLCVVCGVFLLTGNSGMWGLTTLAVIVSISVEARQPLSSSTLTTSTLVCSASK